MRRLAASLFALSTLACRPVGASADPSAASPVANPTPDDVGASSGAPAHRSEAEQRRAPPETEQIGDTTVTVLDVGQEPRQVLRLRPKPGSTEQIQLRMEMAMRQELGNESKPMVRLPAMTMVFTLHVESVEDGTIRCVSETVSHEVEDDGRFPPAVIDKIRAELAGTEGMRISYVLTDRGVAHDMQVDIPSTASPNMRETMKRAADTMRQLSFPLPAEAVGPGARWSVTDGVTAAGLALSQTAEYEFHGCDERGCSFAFGLTQRVTDPDFAPPGMPSEVEARITTFDSSGDGRYVHDLEHISPSSASSGISLRSVFVLEAGGERVEMRMDMDMETEFGLQP